MHRAPSPTFPVIDAMGLPRGFFVVKFPKYVGRDSVNPAKLNFRIKQKMSGIMKVLARLAIVIKKSYLLLP